MSILDSLLGGSPTQLNLGAPALDTSKAAIDKAIAEAGTAPDVPKDSATVGVVDDKGTIGIDAKIDKSLGKDGKFGEVIGEASDSKASGWKVGAWWKKSWGSK